MVGEKLLLTFIRCQVVHPMRSVQDGLRCDIPIGFTIEPHHSVARIRFHREDVSTYRVHIKPVVELNLGFITPYSSLGWGDVVWTRRRR